MNEYQEQAIKFLESTNTTFKAEFLKHDIHFEGDTDTRDIYQITLERGDRSYIFNFGQSLNDSGFYYNKGVQIIPIDRKYLELTDGRLRLHIRRKDWGFGAPIDKIHKPKTPDEYSVLSCLTKYDPYSFEDFCSEYGYDTDSSRAEITYKAVVIEWHNVAMLWNDDEVERLQEIQ